MLAHHLLQDLHLFYKWLFLRHKQNENFLYCCFKQIILFRFRKDQIRAMGERILGCRQLLYNKLAELDVPGDWHHILNQKGMFTFTGLTPKQVSILKEKYHIYLLGSGRINMCALNDKNIDYVTKAFKDVIVNHAEVNGTR